MNFAQYQHAHVRLFDIIDSIGKRGILFRGSMRRRCRLGRLSVEDRRIASFDLHCPRIPYRDLLTNLLLDPLQNGHDLLTITDGLRDPRVFRLDSAIAPTILASEDSFQQQ